MGVINWRKVEMIVMKMIMMIQGGDLGRGVGTGKVIRSKETGVS